MLALVARPLGSWRAGLPSLTSGWGACARCWPSTPSLEAATFVYFGSCTSQPARARAFTDLAVERLVDYTEYVLTERELAVGARKARRPKEAMAPQLRRSS
jgi:hypothetical protein